MVKQIKKREKKKVRAREELVSMHRIPEAPLRIRNFGSALVPTTRSVLEKKKRKKEKNYLFSVLSTRNTLRVSSWLSEEEKRVHTGSV